MKHKEKNKSQKERRTRICNEKKLPHWVRMRETRCSDSTNEENRNEEKKRRR